MREYNGALITSFGHHIIVSRDLALQTHQMLAHARIVGSVVRHLGNVGLANVRRHVFAVKEHLAAAKLDRYFAGQRRQTLGIG